MAGPVAIGIGGAAIGAVGSVVAAGKEKSAAKKAIAAQSDRNAEDRQFIREQAEKARQDVLPLFGGAQQTRRAGAQAALDVFGQTIPQQAQLLQQGNVGAQQTLLSGLPQVQAALLGTPLNLGALQTQQFNFDPSFAQQQLPDVQTPQQLLAPPPVERQPIDPNIRNSLLTGGSFNFGSGLGGIGGNFGSGSRFGANQPLRIGGQL